MKHSVIFRNTIIALLPVLLLALSCTEAGTEKSAPGTPLKVLKVNHTKPACCSNIPSRFSIGSKPGKALK